MQLYNTKVIPSATDTLWDAPEIPDNMGTARLLVISRPFAAGSAEELTLQKMMAACRLSFADYALLIAGADKQYSWQAIAAHAPEVVLMMGVSAAALSIHALFRLNTANAFSGRIFIPSFSLTEIESTPEIKKELWSAALKPLFGA